MLHLLLPYEYTDNIFTIDYKKLYDMGYRGIIFDIDNTLVPHGKPSTAEVDSFVLNIQRLGFKTIFLSDNDEKRVISFLKNIDSMYICNAGKPNPGSFKKAVKMLRIKKEQVIMIGDQMFTDILGANLAGIKNIMVGYIGKGTVRNPGKRRLIEDKLLNIRNNHPGLKDHLEPVTVNNPCSSKDKLSDSSQLIRFIKGEILFCHINPTCFAISEKKEVVKRILRDLIRQEHFASDRSSNKLPCVISAMSSGQIKKGAGIDPVSQYNKLTNIGIACESINGLTIHPGETFSFWKLVGKTTEKKGYKAGRVLENNELKRGLGGGLCNLANTLHLLVLDTPLKVTELHTHSDALAPDNGPHKPFATGTSVSYNNIDFRFKNVTDQDIQILVWTEGPMLYGEIRSEKPFDTAYRLIEEDPHFSKEGSKYYRNSMIYRETIDKRSGNVISRDLLLKNHSEVMYDPGLIPEDMIRK